MTERELLQGFASFVVEAGISLEGSSGPAIDFYLKHKPDMADEECRPYLAALARMEIK